MALYAKDITQSIEPAQANVGTLAKGIEAKAEGARLSANATGTLLKAAGFLAEQYVAYDVGRSMVETEGGMTEQKFATKGKTAEGLTQEMLDRGMAAEKAAQDLPLVTAERDKLAASGTSYSVVPDAETKRQAALGTYDQEIKRLKDAAAGGMSNEEYVSRVSALTRKAIAKYPGLADSIREKVGTITGLPYADRWAEMQYVRERFTKEAKKDSEYDPMKFVVKDIDEIASTGKYSREDLFNKYNNNRPEYDAISKQHNEIKGIKQNLTIVEDTLKSLTAQSDADANLTRGGFAAMFNGYLGMNVTSAYTTTLEANFKDVLGRLNKGDDLTINPDALSTQIQFHNAEMRSAISNSRDATLIAVNNYLATNPNISEEKRKQLKADITSAADLQLSKYADEKGVGLAAMSVIMVNYRDKTLKEKRDLIDLVIRQVDSMKNTPLVMAYYGMGASRENLKLTNKPFYDHMVRLEKLQSDATNGIIDQIEVFKALRETGDIIDKAYNDPAAVVAPTNAEPANVKAAHAAMQSNAQTSLDKATQGKVLDAIELNVISSAQATNVETGANSQLLANDYKKIGDKIRLLPAESQAIIKENVSRAARGNVMSMLSMKEMLEAKHGVTLTLGVTPTGQIVAMPTPLSKEEQAQQKALGMAKIPLTDKRRKEPIAIDEFNKQSKAKLSNLVFGRVMLTQEDPVAVANDFATMINNRQPYGGFYSNAPVAPSAVAAPVESTSVVPASELGSQQFPTTPAPAAAAPVTSNAPTDQSKVVKFNPEGENYDYETARKYGMGPDGTGENAGHWGSVAPASKEDKQKYKLPDESYVILKGRKHETWQKAVDGEQERGFEVRKFGDRYFSVPVNKARTTTGKLIDETKKTPAARTTGGNLKVGEVVNGFTYTGGDPTNRANWKK